MGYRRSEAAYAASKAGLLGLTRDLAAQWTSRKGIRVAMASTVAYSINADSRRPVTDPMTRRYRARRHAWGPRPPTAAGSPSVIVATSQAIPIGGRIGRVAARRLSAWPAKGGEGRRRAESLQYSTLAQLLLESAE
jgi:NAD(P)-dependent dehydrogenase (short-subunit alcohol dehydrogenase family)